MNMKLIIKNLFFFCFILFSFIGTNAQDKTDLPPPLPVEDDVDCVLTAPELTRFNVSVWSSKKGFLNDLTYKDFEVYDEREKQEILFFSRNNAPVSVGILLDLSGSMRFSESSKYNEIPFVVEGLISFINKSNPQNEYFIVGFAKDASVLLDTTQNKKEIENALKTILTIKPDGNTSVYDALDLGFEKISKGKFDKKVLLVISDGMDNNSDKYDFGDIKKINRKENALIYMVNFITNFRDSGSLEMIGSVAQFETLTENSGGRIFYPKNRGEVIGSFELLAEELKNQYIIGFASNSSEKDKWRDIKIEFNLPKEKKKEYGKIYVRAANGYYSK
jgi:Ca-activated chloride channel family protein